MTEKLPSTSYIFVDRRKTGTGKSLGNRQRLLRRIKDAIHDAKPEDIDAGGVRSGGTAATSKNNANAVKVTKQSLKEPVFQYAARTGTRDNVLIGNDRWVRGDKIPVRENDDDGDSGGGSGEGEDDFIVHISREEFFNVFFEDCELPDLSDTTKKELPELMPKHAGFQKEGNPAQLSVIRSYKNAMPRRRALTTDARAELEELEALKASYEDGSHEQCQMIYDAERIDIIIGLAERIMELKTKISAVPFFEKMDLRFTKKDKVLVKSADAVFAMIMDISGSMGEEEKRIARKFFTLQYAFIKRKYPQTDLIFIAHTDAAEEMSEEEFFTTRKSGGTVVSPAYTLLNKIINQRYDSKLTNIYLSQATDGDNSRDDNEEISKELVESGLLKKLRHMTYTQIGEPSIYGGRNELWEVMLNLRNEHKKLQVCMLTDESEVFDVFHSIYKKKNTA